VACECIGNLDGVHLCGVIKKIRFCIVLYKISENNVFQHSSGFCTRDLSHGRNTKIDHCSLKHTKKRSSTQAQRVVDHTLEFLERFVVVKMGESIVQKPCGMP